MKQLKRSAIILKLLRDRDFLKRIRQMESIVDQKQRPELDLSFEYAGHRFYTPKNIGDLSVARKKALVVRQGDVDRGIIHEDLVKFTDLLGIALENGKIHDIAGLNVTLNALIRQPATAKPVLYLSSAVVYLDDETELTPEWETKKMELAEKHPAIEDFFLTVGLALLNPSKDSLTDSEAWDFLKNRYMRSLEKDFLTRISSGINLHRQKQVTK